MMKLSIASASGDLFFDHRNSGRYAFNGLSGLAAARFAAMGIEVNYNRGAALFSEGEPARRVFFLRSGRIKLCVTSREGKTMILRISEPGQILGLTAALTASPYEMSAQSLETSCAKAIATNDFLSFLEEYPDAAREATHCVLQDYQLILSDIRRLALPETVAGRLAYLLLDWLKSYCQPGKVKARLTLDLTHEQLAEMTGTSRETVSRVLRQFQRDNVIRIHGSSLTVLKQDALEKLAA